MPSAKKLQPAMIISGVVKAASSSSVVKIPTIYLRAKIGINAKIAVSGTTTFRIREKNRLASPKLFAPMLLPISAADD